MPFAPEQANRHDDFVKRIYIFSILPVTAFIIILGVLFFLQIIRGPDYELRAKTNREQFSILPAIRGIIYDRSGEKVLAYNRRSYEVVIVPQNLPKNSEERGKLLIRLATLLNEDIGNIKKTIQLKDYSSFGSNVVKTDVPFEDIVFLAEHNRDFPGVYWKSKPIRVYPLGENLAHVIGYVGLIDEKDLLEYADRGYNIESAVGKSGVEKLYDMELKGRDGYIRRIVDATNQVTTEIIDKGAEPQPGNNVLLTIDTDIQLKAKQALGERTGTVIVSKPSTGEILALVSNPSFDPNLFVSQKDREAFKRLTLDKRKPFINRAIQAQYPPGSIFKLLVAIALLDSGKVSPQREFVCGGGYKTGNRFFACWANHGIVDFNKAITISCDSYFYQVSLILGPELIYQYATRLGFGKRLGIDLGGEIDGLVPDKKWKMENLSEIWFDGDTLNLSIGQGYLLATLLQLNTLTNLIANKGTIYKPYIVKEIRSAKNGDILYSRTREALVESNIARENFDILQKAMRNVVTDGTAKWGGAVFSTKMAGKTSTVETAGDTTHSIFTAFAPYDASDPNEVISVTAIVEHGGAGSASAAPIVALIVESLFGKSDLETAQRNIWRKRGEIGKARKENEERG